MTTCADAHLQKLRSFILQGWPHKKDELEHSIKHYWPIRSVLSMIDGSAMRGKNNYSFSIAETNSTAVAQEPHGHGEDEAHDI